MERFSYLQKLQNKLKYFMFTLGATLKIYKMTSNNKNIYRNQKITLLYTNHPTNGVVNLINLYICKQCQYFKHTTINTH